MMDERQTQALADYLPNGRLFEAKNVFDSNFRDLLRGLSGEMFTAQGYLTEFEEEFFPDATNLFLSEWEQALAIPDDCFSGQGTNAERRRDILVKLSSLGVQTAEDFEALGLLYGVAITVTPAIEEATFTYSFPIPLFYTHSDAKYTIYIDFPLSAAGGFFIYSFSIVFGDATQSILECLFKKLAPANCNLIFRTT